MAYIKTFRRQSGGNGGGGTPNYTDVGINVPYTAGTTILNIPPASLLTGDSNSIIVWFQKNFAQLNVDWSYSSIDGDLRLLFSFDPAIDYPPAGAVTVDIWYWQA